VGAFGSTTPPVPFTPGLGADSFGHLILLSSDTTELLILVLMPRTLFIPSISRPRRTPGSGRLVALPHFGPYQGDYAVLRNQTYPVRTSIRRGNLCARRRVSRPSVRRIPPFVQPSCVGEMQGRQRLRYWTPGLWACVSQNSIAWHANEDTDCAGNSLFAVPLFW
jgi:hypothetical protein